MAAPPPEDETISVEGWTGPVADGVVDRGLALGVGAHAAAD